MLRNIGLSNLPVNFLLIPIERPFLTPHHHAGKKAAFQRALNSRKQPGVFSENFKRVRLSVGPELAIFGRIDFPAKQGGFHDGFPGPDRPKGLPGKADGRSEEHTSELQSLMRISYTFFCLTKTKY